MVEALLAVNHLTWLLEIELKPSVREEHAIILRATCPVPLLFI